MHANTNCSDLNTRTHIACLQIKAGKGQQYESIELVPVISQDLSFFLLFYVFFINAHIHALKRSGNQSSSKIT